MEGHRPPRPPARVAAGLRAMAAQVKPRWCFCRKARTSLTVLPPFWPGRIFHPRGSQQHLRRGSSSPPLCAGNASPKQLLPCQRRLRQKNPSQPRMQAAQSTPLHNSAVPKGTSGSIASPRRAASSRLSASAPNTCLGPLPSSTPALGHRAARGVTDPSRAMAKGPRPRGDTAGHVPSPGEHLSGDVPKRRAQEEGARGHVSPGPVATP